VKLSNILYLYRTRLRARLPQEGFAALGIAIGVALLFASQVANTSLTGGAGGLVHQLVGSARLELSARSPEGFDQRLAGRVARLPGVKASAPVLREDAAVVSSRSQEPVQLLGISAAALSLGSLGSRDFGPGGFRFSGGLLLSQSTADALGVRAGGYVTVLVSGTAHPIRVGAIFNGSMFGGLASSPVAVTSLALAQLLSERRGRVTQVFVEPRPGSTAVVARELRGVAGSSLDVLPADHELRLLDEAAVPNDQSTSLFTAISVMVGLLLALNAMLLTVPQRRKLIGDLRLDGYTPWEIVEVLLVDALALGLAGSLAGLALGELLSLSLIHSSPGYLSFAFPIGSQRIVTFANIALPVAGGLLAACVGVLAPLTEIFAARPIAPQISRGRKTASRLWAPAAGVACLAITTAILLAGIASTQAALAAFVSLIAGMLLLLPLLLRGAIVLVDQLQRPVVGVSPEIALSELRSKTTRARSLAIAATGAVAVFGIVAVDGAHRNVEAGLARLSNELASNAQVWVTPSGADNLLATTPFPATDLAPLQSLPDVRSVSLYRGGFLDWGNRRVWVIAPPVSAAQPVPPRQILSGNAGLASTRVRAGGWLVLSKAIAEEHHLHLGQAFTLATPIPTIFRVAGLSTNAGWPSGVIVMNADDYARSYASVDPSAYNITLDPGVTPARGALAVRGALRSSAGLTVETAAEREQRDYAVQRQGLSRLSQIAAVVLIAAVLAMAAAMGALIWQRRPRLASIKVDGFDRGELWRALLLETVLLLGIGCSIGAVFGLYGELVLSRALANVTGFPVAQSVGVLVALGSFAIVSAIAAAIVAIPGYLAAGTPPAIALQD
jgi:putative ABC transport system permease protein